MVWNGFPKHGGDTQKPCGLVGNFFGGQDGTALAIVDSIPFHRPRALSDVRQISKGYLTVFKFLCQHRIYVIAVFVSVFSRFVRDGRDRADAQ